MTVPRHLVVLRFSAMGDVALTLPVIRSLLLTHPDLRITLVTRPRFTGIFRNIHLPATASARLEVMGADVDGKFKGLSGLWRLSRQLSKLAPDTVVDLHDHLRTRILRTFLWISGISILTFDKGRSEKRLATGSDRVNHRKPLKTTIERYGDAFHAAGYTVAALPPPHILSGTNASPQILPKDFHWIGIAPFAAHATKQWAIENFGEVIASFRRHEHIRFMLFGGKSDAILLETLAAQHSNCVSIAGKYSMDEELAIISSLKVMLTVDSSNMHLAGLCGIPVVSVWGGTHTITGFGPAPHPANEIVEVSLDELPCRPCSVYGKSKCPRGDWACLRRITPDQVSAALQRALPH